MSKDTNRKGRRRGRSVPNIEEDIWIDAPPELIESMRCAVPPEKWSYTQTTILERYNEVLNRKGELAAKQWAEEETAGYKSIGKKSEKDKLFDRGTKLAWSGSAIARLLFELFQH
jgi:hypothetical protein